MKIGPSSNNGYLVESTVLLPPTRTSREPTDSPRVVSSCGEYGNSVSVAPTLSEYWERHLGIFLLSPRTGVSLFLKSRYVRPGCTGEQGILNKRVKTS